MSDTYTETFRSRARALPLAQAPKEKNMKRTISLWIGLLAFAVMPALAQTPAPAPANGQTAGQPTGKIHGKITNPTGAPQSGGTTRERKKSSAFP
jgi:hypothetical protein